MVLDGEKIESLMIGDYKIIQSENLYRFTSDAVYLSRFAEARAGDTVADLCSGSGIVGLHFYALNERKIRSVDLFEIQAPLAEMSLRSVELNSLSEIFTVHNVAIQNIDEGLSGKFSLVLCNPPYKKQSSGPVTEQEYIAICKHEMTVNIDDIADVSERLLKRGGRIALCNKCERLIDVINAFQSHNLHPSRLKFVSGGENAAPYLFMIEAVKDVNRQLKIEKTLVNTAKDFSGN